MAGGYVAGAPDAYSQLVDELREVRSRLTELEVPTGSQLLNNGTTIDANVVTPVTLYRLDSPFVSSSVTEFAQISTPVPDGCTRALVSITATAGLKGEQASGWSNILVSAGIMGTARNTSRNAVPAGLYGSVATAASAVLTGLTAGSNVDVSAFAAFYSTYSAPQVAVAGSILFLR